MAVTDWSEQVRAWINHLWAGKWVFLATFVIVVAAGAWYTFSQSPLYRTGSLILIDEESNQGLPQIGNTRSSSFYSRDSPLSNELFVIRNSRVIPERVATKLLEMGTHPDTGEPLRITRRSDDSGSLGLRGVAYRVQGMTSVSMARDDVDGLHISAVGTRPAEAALVANLFSEAYVEQNREKSRESVRAQRTYLLQQAEKLQKEVEDADESIESYIKDNEAVALDQEAGRIVQKISDLEAEQDAARIERNLLETEISNRTERLRETEQNLPSQYASGVGTQLENVRKRKAELELRIETIRDRNPNLTARSGGTLALELRQAQEQIRELSARADSLAQVYVDNTIAAGGSGNGSGESTGSIRIIVEERAELAALRVKVEGQKARLESIQNQLASARQRLDRIPEQSMQLAQLQRQRRSTEKIYGYIQEKLQEIRLAEESELGTAEIIRTAGIPRNPISPNVTRNLFFAALFGLGLGAALVIIREKMDTRTRHPEDLRSLGYGVLGVVPDMDRLIQDDFDGASEVNIDGETFSTSLVMLLSPMSSVTESYRRIRTNLQFSRPDTEIRTLAVSSADKGDGKTTTASNLAIAMASAGKRTLLVDADLRRPRMHEMFHVSPDRKGLTDALFDANIDGHIIDSSVDDLFLLPTGMEVPNPAELLSSKRMNDLAEDLRERFDFVIFDTPPVLIFSDGVTLARRCDGALLVVSSNKTDERALTHAAERLTIVGADLLGCVLNRYTANSFLPDYGYNYGYTQSYQRLAEYYSPDDTKPSARASIRSWFE
jgi:polysaccharide biosynthesis transport protein